MAERTSGAATSRETRAATARQSRATRPEQVVVAEPPPEPDYPRYRVEPGTALRLSAVDPDESEHFGRKKDVAPELATTGTASPTCRPGCTRRTGAACCSCCRRWTPAARTAPSSTSSAG